MTKNRSFFLNPFLARRGYQQLRFFPIPHCGGFLIRIGLLCAILPHAAGGGSVAVPGNGTTRGQFKR